MRRMDGFNFFFFVVIDIMPSKTTMFKSEILDEKDFFLRSCIIWIKIIYICNIINHLKNKSYDREKSKTRNTAKGD